MRAAFAVLGTVAPGKGRRIVVLGDMLELGAEGAALHAGLSGPIADAHVDLVFCAGPLMENLWRALPVGRRGAYAATAAELEPHVIRTLRSGDIVMVKGSRSSRMAPLVETLKTRFPAEVPDDAALGVA
jgi:UDP-N-acetylmuramoyl-tripeptide--D-alanyl-D-alanine ligase